MVYIIFFFFLDKFLYLLKSTGFKQNIERNKKANSGEFLELFY